MSDETKAPQPLAFNPKQGTPISVNDILAAAQPGATVKFKRVPGFKEGQVFVIKSVSAGAIIDWTESASSGDEAKKREAGLQLIIQSVVDGEPGVDKDAKGVLLMNDAHIPVLRDLQHRDTERVVKGIIDLNEMTLKGAGDAKKA